MPLPIYTGNEIRDFEAQRIELRKQGKLCRQCSNFEIEAGSLNCWGCNILNEPYAYVAPGMPVAS